MANEVPQDVELMLSVGLEGDGPGKLADCVSVAHDVEFAHQCFVRLTAVDPDGDPVLTHALWSAGVIAYRRAFSSGKGLAGKGRSRRGLHEYVDGLEAAFGGIHRRLLHDADKFIAHRVNDAEQIVVQLLLSNPAVNRHEVEGVGILFARRIGPADGDLERAVAITSDLVRVAAEAVDYSRAQLLESARSEPPDRWYEAARAMGP